ncbi:hypothetical protein PM082_007041 [Marasmius tenuissimus]|nr:hypothetical protein PM082_007041 [Marasmius tenuissimus]
MDGGFEVTGRCQRVVPVLSPALPDVGARLSSPDEHIVTTGLRRRIDLINRPQFSFNELRLQPDGLNEHSIWILPAPSLSPAVPETTHTHTYDLSLTVQSRVVQALIVIFQHEYDTLRDCPRSNKARTTLPSFPPESQAFGPAGHLATRWQALD